MWVLRYQDDAKVLVRYLRFHGIYEVGRDCDETDGTSIQIQNDNVSRKHLSISVEPPSAGIYSSERTSLKVTFKTRASTIVNGEKYKLAKGQGEFEKEFTESGITMEFKNEVGTITVKWESMNVFPFDTESELIAAYNDGADIRIVKCVDADYMVAQKAVSGFIGAVAMVHHIPIYSVEWISRALNQVNGLSEDHEELKIENYALKTSDLFKNHHFFLTQPDINLQDILSRNGAEVDLESLRGIHSASKVDRERKLTSYNNPVVLSESPSELIKSLTEQLQIPIIGYQEIYIALRDQKIDFIPPSRKRTVESIEPAVSQDSEVGLGSQSQWRRRKRHKKVDNLAFMMPSSVPSSDAVEVESSQPASKELKQEETAQERETAREKELEKVPKENEPTTEAPEKEAVEIPISETKDKPNTSATKDNVKSKKRQVITASEFMDIEDLAFDPEDQRNTKKPKIKLESDINDSLYHAFKESKKTMDEKIKEDLGLEENKDIGSQMTNLAIVETVDIPMRTKKPVSDNPMYQGRKNVKKFKKNMKLKSAVTRTFVEVDDGFNVQRLTEFEKNAFSNGNDTDGANSDTDSNASSTVKEMEPERDSQVRIPENDLFVSNESQSQVFDLPSNKPTPRKSKPIGNHKEPSTNNSVYSDENNDNDDDEDDLDDMPKFAFTDN